MLRYRSSRSWRYNRYNAYERATFRKYQNNCNTVTLKFASIDPFLCSRMANKQKKKSHIQVGNVLPSTILYEEDPDNEKNILELVAHKKAIIFGVPGAFIPGCSRVHLTGFIQKSDDLRKLGFEEIICVAVNDPFVLTAWATSKFVEDKVRMLADPQAIFTKSIGMDVDMPELGGIRSRRYSMATVNGIVRELFVDAPNIKQMCLWQDGIPTYCH